MLEVHKCDNCKYRSTLINNLVGCTKKKKIIINDYLDDKLCYSKTVTADEFLSLFSINNSDFLNKFFEDKIDKNKIKAK